MSLGSTTYPESPGSGLFDSLIDWANAEVGRRLAVDLPSGLDCDTGEPAPPTLSADDTCTFVAPKAGFTNPAARDYLGEVHVVGIGAPAAE